MNDHSTVRFVIFLIAALPATVSTSAATVEPETRFESVEVDGEKMEYAVVLPADFDSAKTYPMLLALPPGAQNREMVNAGLSLYWQQGSEANGWVVISPVAPNGKFFNAGSKDLIPGFLEKVQEKYKPEGGKFHLAGVSNGGTSVFRVAGKYPELFFSLMALPGYPVAASDKQRLKKMVDLPIAMFAGEKDTAWVKPMESSAATLKKMGADVQIEIIAGQGHVIQNWQDGKKLFKILNGWHAKAVEKPE